MSNFLKNLQNCSEQKTLFSYSPLNELSSFLNAGKTKKIWKRVDCRCSEHPSARTQLTAYKWFICLFVLFVALKKKIPWKFCILLWLLFFWLKAFFLTFCVFLNAGHHDSCSRPQLVLLTCTIQCPQYYTNLDCWPSSQVTVRMLPVLLTTYLTISPWAVSGLSCRNRLNR